MTIKILKLILCSFCVWLLCFVILPYHTKISPSAQQLANFIDESGIETGQFYYTSVEIVAHAEAGARGAVFFTDHHKKKTTSD